MARAGAAVLGAALLAVVCVPCAAEDLELPDPYEEEDITEQEGEGPAIEHFNSGVEFFREELYSAALAEFLESYSLNPNWAVLYNIGVCYHRLGRYEDAIRELEAYLERGGAWIPPQRKALVNKLLDQMSASTGTIIIEHEEPGVRVWIDGKSVYDTPVSETIVVAAGLHTVSAFSEGYYPLELEVPVPSGAEVVVPIEMEETPVLRSWQETYGKGGKLTSTGRLRLAALSFWACAGLALTGGLVTSAIMLAREEQSRPLELATTILLSSAGGATITGLVLWLAFRITARKRMSHSMPWLSVAPASGRGAMVVFGMRTF
jgi:hypothetical protein